MYRIVLRIRFLLISATTVWLSAYCTLLYKYESRDLGNFVPRGRVRKPVRDRERTMDWVGCVDCVKKREKEYDRQRTRVDLFARRGRETREDSRDERECRRYFWAISGYLAQQIVMMDRDVLFTSML